MGILDVVLIILGLSAGVGSYMTGSDSLYKLFLGLIIGFLSYLVISCQIEMLQFLSPSMLNPYQSFLSKHATGILSLALLAVPFLGLFFMLNPRFSFGAKKRSPSHLLLGSLLPIFLIGILSYLASTSILSESETWKNIFSFFEGSGLYGVFQKLPWVIFLLLAFLIFYKSIFLLLAAFLTWLYREVFAAYFRDWNRSKKKTSSHDEIQYEDE